MIEKDGEIYHNAAEAARYLRCSRCKFYRNVKPHLKSYRFGTTNRLHYKQSDLERFNVVKMVA